MARKSNPGGICFLRRQVAELAAVNEALGLKLADTAATLQERDDELALVAESLAEQRRLKEYHKQRYDEAFDLYRETSERAKRLEAERDHLRSELSPLRWTLAGVERERDVARALADVMRSQAFPAPQFPWECEIRSSGANGVGDQFAARRP